MSSENLEDAETTFSIQHQLYLVFLYSSYAIGVTLLFRLFKNIDIIFGRPSVPACEPIENILARFRPLPLVSPVPEHLKPKPRLVSSKPGKRVFVNSKECLNLATTNYLGFLEDSDVQKKAAESIKKYGVGSCGPRGFYGTVDVHLELEQRLAEFTKTEEACVYSYGFATMSSVIPSYCKRHDVVFADAAVNFSIQKGIEASRCHVCYFKHNDLEDLEGKLWELLKGRQLNSRWFLIVEGVYFNTGNLCDLPGLVNLAKKHKMRLFIDETVSMGTMGKTGRGVLEYFNIPEDDVDLRIGSLEGAFASIGGFCCGNSYLVEHQRLSGLGYCFSASLPPMLAVAAITALNKLDTNPDLVLTLQKVAFKTHQAFSDLSGVKVKGHPESPIKHLYFREPTTTREEMDRIVEYCWENSLAIVQPSYLDSEVNKPKPSIRISVQVNLSDDDIEFAKKVLQDAFNKCLIPRDE